MQCQTITDRSNVVLDSHVEWKDIPGYSKYQASNLGYIRYNNKDTGVIRLCGFREKKTSVGSYINASVLSDDLKVRSKEEHHLVCLAFHGFPPDDGKKYEVNHKDGNKHNNRPENLEWVTRSQNLQHAYESGLRKDKVSVIVHDILTGTCREYPTIGSVAREFGMEHKKMIGIIDRFYKNAYLDRYRFERVLDNEYRPPSFTFVKTIVAYDYKNKRTIIADTSAIMQQLTKIKRATILYALNNNSKSLIGGYSFRYLEDGGKFETYTESEIEESIGAYFDKKEPRDRIYGVQFKNYLTGEITECETFKEAEMKTGVCRGTIRHLLANKNRLFKGYWFKYSNDSTEYPIFDKEYIDVSIRINKPEYPIIAVADLELNTTKLYASIAEFAREKGFDPVVVASYVRLYPTKPYAKRYDIKRMA